MLNPIRLPGKQDSQGFNYPGSIRNQRINFAARRIRVLVADDHALIRGGIRALIEKLPELQIVAEASDGPEALRLIGQHQPDVALIKTPLSRLKGVEVVVQVRKEWPWVHVIVLSAHTDVEFLRQAQGCGAAGYLTMNDSASELELAIKTVAFGKTHISSSVIDPLVDLVSYGAGDGTKKALTPRQREVLRLLAQGNSTKRIALLLNISVKTIETHRMLLMERLDIHDIAGLVRYAIKAGLIRLED
jgi:DNA-binding NarL/FixJ family response regulator